ncbi:ABC transporter permease [Leuconostoc sp. MS02]|uniref:ABC transporter permease n=1 Tax=Leuconostoc aquikimchii TaxID=3236804 RepID=A0ABV3S567_9LACO
MNDIISVFLKKHLSQLIILIVTVFFMNIVLFVTSFDVIQVGSGYQNLSKLTKSTAYIGNNESSDSLREKIGNDKTSKTKDSMVSIIDQVNKNFKSVSQIQFDSPKFNGSTQITISPNALSLFNIAVKEGKYFTNKHYSNKNSVPVLVGSHFAKKYRIDKTFTDMDQISGKQRHYHVVGILQDNARIPSFYNVNDYTSLNDSYLVPLQINYFKQNIAYDNFDLYLQNLIIFTNKTQKINHLEQSLINKHLYKVKFNIEQKNVEEYLHYFKQKLIIELTALLICFIVCMLIIRRMIHSLLKEEQKNITTIFILGQSVSDIQRSIKNCFGTILVIANTPIILFELYKLQYSPVVGTPIESWSDVVTNVYIQCIMVLIVMMAIMYLLIYMIVMKNFKKINSNLK